MCNKFTADYCSFCGKGRDEVKHLISGPTVFICDVCVVLAVGIIKTRDAKAAQERLGRLDDERTVATVAPRGYVVVYRTGDTLRCTWRCSAQVHCTRETASAEIASLARMGYKAMGLSLDDLDAVGLPIGWEHTSVDWENDTVEVSTWQTTWTSSTLASKARRPCI